MSAYLELKKKVEELEYELDKVRRKVEIIGEAYTALDYSCHGDPYKNWHTFSKSQIIDAVDGYMKIRFEARWSPNNISKKEVWVDKKNIVFYEELPELKKAKKKIEDREKLVPTSGKKTL